LQLSDRPLGTAPKNGTLSAGKKNQLVGKFRERYGHEKDVAEKEVDDFIHSL
jgi:uncharacterized protein YjbJ (UPF0337 family)